jgi:ribosome maturation protein SDO1
MAISVEAAVIARLHKGGQRFEILVDPDKALALRQGKSVDSEELLAAPEVYEDARKGTRVASEVLNKIFGTNSMSDIASKIVREGELQLTEAQRKTMMEERTRAVAGMIARQGVDPRTGAPHPIDRVLRAMEQAKVRIDAERPGEQQVDSVLKAIQSVIPVRFERVQIAIKISAEYAARAAGVVRNFGTPSKEEWAADGSYIAVLELAAGMQTELYDKINALTKGSAQIKVIKREGVQ